MQKKDALYRSHIKSLPLISNGKVRDIYDIDDIAKETEQSLHQRRSMGKKRNRDDIEDRTIDSHVKRIRKKFKKVDEDFSAIETRYGSGYRWNVS